MSRQLAPSLVRGYSTDNTILPCDPKSSHSFALQVVANFVSRNEKIFFSAIRGTGRNIFVRLQHLMQEEDIASSAAPDLRRTMQRPNSVWILPHAPLQLHKMENLLLSKVLSEFFCFKQDIRWSEEALFSPEGVGERSRQDFDRVLRHGSAFSMIFFRVLSISRVGRRGGGGRQDFT